MNSMKKRLVMSLTAVVVVLFPPIAGSQPASGEVLVGPLNRQQVRAIVAKWGDTDVRDDRWTEVIGKLREVEPGARVEVFFGTWCDDSQQQIPRLMKVLEKLEGREPFTVAFVGVDKEKRQPADEIKARQVQNLPTIVVTRAGQEIGRIVEHPARTLETDLLRLLDGSARGLLSSSETAILQYLQGARATLTRPASLRPPR